jgi:hypothetical protein
MTYFLPQEVRGVCPQRLEVAMEAALSCSSHQEPVEDFVFLSHLCNQFGDLSRVETGWGS